MAKKEIDKVIAQWAKVGVFFGGSVARKTPDLERLLLNTAQCVCGSARLFYHCVSWLSQYGNFVARHRLKHLTQTGLPVEHQPALAALLSLAVKHGASRELLIAADVCQKVDAPRPLFDVQQRSKTLANIAKQQASDEALHWNLWVTDQAPKLDAIRPAHWIIERNTDYLARIIRKGDLRCSTLQVLEHDTPNRTVESEISLAQLCSANRIAVRHALDDLELEGFIERIKTPGTRNIQIQLTAPATALG
ncbi:MAG TPA: hypothetical protein DER01_21715 [Phycisphaerales bacterium]|nr:hypothetical protein [Phycisphaerales bacterium]